MPDDKRPKPTIDMTLKPANDTTSPATPADDTGERLSAEESPASNETVRSAERGRGGGFFSHLMASILGAVLVAGGIYLVSIQDIPGFTLTSPDTRRELDELRTRIASVDSAMRSQSRPSAASTVATGPDALKEVRAQLEAVVNGSRALDDRLQALSQRLSGLEQKSGSGAVKDLVKAELASETASLVQRLSSLERNLEGLTRAQNQSQAEARAAGLTLALSDLRRAVVEGRPFAAELAAAENLSAVQLPVSQLSPYKSGGIPTLAELRREFDSASRQALQSHYRSNAGTVMGEVMARAKAAIQVRSSDASGNSAEAILGRMEMALKEGNLREVLAAAAALEGPAREQLQAWIDKVEKRAAADEALSKTDQVLLATLTKTTAPRP